MKKEEMKNMNFIARGIIDLDWRIVSETTVVTKGKYDVIACCKDEEELKISFYKIERTMVDGEAYDKGTNIEPSVFTEAMETVDKKHILTVTISFGILNSTALLRTEITNAYTKQSFVYYTMKDMKHLPEFALRRIYEQPMMHDVEDFFNMALNKYKGNGEK